MDRPVSDITVSICCITYNHEEYIAQTIEGFLMQKTNFKIEILIGEDCSTDQTGEIVKEYTANHPSVIRLITSETNVGPTKNVKRVVEAATGKYVAFCEGDDFWTDERKLQKQIDLLENDANIAICCHYARVIDDSDALVYEAEELIPFEYTYNDLLLGKRHETRTSSIVCRNSPELKQIFENEWYHRTFGSDVFLKLYIIANTGGKIYVIPEVMSTYRLHRGGIFSMIDPKIRKGRMLNDFNIIVNHFSYSTRLKRKLLFNYFTQFFLFELRNFKLRSAYNTISSLI
ncbi:glycosyltransferase [Pedobacter sp. P351]|uniref:glycosyltransferase family 2 protein n=1 Tax=Pedobacter superstes TaxID=3133441 RepID=UPI0030ABE082